MFTCKQTVNVAESISFDGSDSFDLDGDIVLYTWNFGDNVIEYGETATHQYTADGSYAATLTVTDDEGNIGSSIQMIVVLPPEPLSASTATINSINGRSSLGVTLSEPFLCYDGNGDGICTSGESCMKFVVNGDSFEKYEKNSEENFKDDDDSFFLQRASAEVLK